MIRLSPLLYPSFAHNKYNKLIIIIMIIQFKVFMFIYREI